MAYLSSRYFQQKAAQKQAVEDMDSDADSVSDAEFDDYLGECGWMCCFWKGTCGLLLEEVNSFLSSDMLICQMIFVNIGSCNGP